MKYVFFHHEMYPLPIAYHLMNEGREVLVGTIDSHDDLGIPGDKDEETEEEKEQRMSVYDGLLDKMTAEDLMDYLESVPDGEKDGYFFFFDFNDLYPISEQVMEMGFTKGLFPTEEHFQMEKDRDKAKEYVKKNYPLVKVAESNDFKDVEEGLEFLADTDDVYVLKSNGNVGKTVVPNTDDPEVGKKMLANALEKERENYEQAGFILEKKILNYMEISPCMLFWNGKPICSLAEFENKEFGAGNIGVQKGGNQNLSVRTDLDSYINEIAFPKAAMDYAAKQKGLYLADAGLLYDGKDFYFTEFCGNRFGWCGVFAEMSMREDGKPFVAKFFEDIMKGRSPLVNKYGTSLRLFNLEGKYEITEESKDDQLVFWDKGAENNFFAYRIKEGEDGFCTVGGLDLLGAITAGGNDIKSTVDKLYERAEKVHFEKKYHRPEFDFLSKDYPTSIMNRYEALRPFLLPKKKYGEYSRLKRMKAPKEALERMLA
ncbi:MAG: hypothetical protein KGJ13_10420 [Patescibacteria group bacterium]|nr:hypothetical protein [Patescibacteria group bacterium]